MPNQALEPTTLAVTPCAPSSTSRASQDRGSSLTLGQIALVVILYLENHAVFAKQVTRQFLSAHEVTIVPSLSEARSALLSRNYDLVLSDYDLDDGKGEVFVRECRVAYPQLPIIAVSSHDTGNAALMRAGAFAACGKMQFNRIQEVISALLNDRT